MSGKRQYCAGTRNDGRPCTRWWFKDNHPKKLFCQDHKSQSRRRTSNSSLPSRTPARSPATPTKPRQRKASPGALPSANARRIRAGASPPSPNPPPRRTGAKRSRRTTVDRDRAKYFGPANPSSIDTGFPIFDRDGSDERLTDRLFEDSPSRRRWRRGNWLGTHRRQTASNRRTASERAKDSLVTDSLTIDTDLVTYAFDRDGFYERLADRLLDNLPWRRRLRRGHWLCTRLDSLTRGVDPGTYAKQVQKPIRDGLIALGFPNFIATVLGAGAGVGLKITLGYTPIGHLASALRVLIALVCPDLGKCPTKHDVVKTFASPMLGEYLKEMAGEPVH